MPALSCFHWVLMTMGCASTPAGSTRTDTAAAVDTHSGVDDTETSLPNLLANGGFELGESWSRPAGFTNHAWAKTGDAIYQSSETFSAFEGLYSFKIWGFYSGDVPNDSEQGLTLVDLTAGDEHVVSVQAFTAEDDAVSGGNAAVVFLRYYDGNGTLIEEHTSGPVDADFPRDVWQELRVEATVPDGASTGALGVRFSLADWGATGSVYVDDVSWTSTGTGAVSGERLLVWHDEFDGDELDEASWTRLEIPAYTYNNEYQRYTTSTQNAAVKDGQLVITARQESDGSVTSARLVTDGKAEWNTGRIEAYAQVPGGIGTWPAFWMLPSEWVYGGWPDSGEIDIMEHVGCSAGSIYQTVHTGAYNHLLGTQLGGETGRDATGGMHLYAVDWYADRLVFTVDGEEVFVFANDGAGNSATWPFDQTFHIILNLAFGGDWGGWCGMDTASLPQEYRIDWVRVYQ